MVDRDDERANEPDRASSRRGSRLWTFVLAVAMSLLVGSCCLCGIFLSQQWPTFEQDPAAAEALTNELLSIEIPPNFDPQGTIDWNIWLLMHMRGAYFAHTIEDGELTLLEVDSRFIEQADFRQHIVNSLHQHGAGSGFDLNVKQTETKTFDVNGEQVPFEFLTAEDRSTGDGRRLVDGVVTINGRPVLVSLWVDEEIWDEAMVERLIESIGPTP